MLKVIGEIFELKSPCAERSSISGLVIIASNSGILQAQGNDVACGACLMDFMALKADGAAFKAHCSMLECGFVLFYILPTSKQKSSRLAALERCG
ncbi:MULTISPECIES: hypothetical protein [Aphanothece]|uniref:hypothetical protein n=1 Tax=Aphanothece TaxID=1121 RepID=UPI00398520D6